jgi:DNA-binding GntR family transcriptional regulator
MENGDVVSFGETRRTLYRRHLLVRGISGAAERTDASHGPIVDAIHARDPEAALAAMDAHFRTWDKESSKVLSSSLSSFPSISRSEPNVVVSNERS